MSMYYGLSLPFDAAHMNGMLPSSLYSSSTTPTHLSQQQQQPLALPLSLAPSLGGAVTLQQYQQLYLLQQLQQQQQLEAANATSPAGNDISAAQDMQQRTLQQQQQQQHRQQLSQLQQQHQLAEATTDSSQPSTAGFSPLSSPTRSAAYSALSSSHASSALPSSVLRRFDAYTSVSEAMNDAEYVAMLAERWRGGGYGGQSLKQLAIDDLAERRKAKRRQPVPLSTHANSPSHPASSLALPSGSSSPLRSLHTPLRANGHGSHSQLAAPTPSSFLASHFNFSPLTSRTQTPLTANTPASLLSPGRDGLGSLFSPSRFYASPAVRGGKQAGKKRTRDGAMTLQPLNLNADDDEQSPKQSQQQHTEQHSYMHQQHASSNSSTANGYHAVGGDDDDARIRAAHDSFQPEHAMKRAAGSSGGDEADDSEVRHDGVHGSKQTQQRGGKRNEGAAGGKRSNSRKAKQQKEKQQQLNGDGKRRQQNGASSGSSSLAPNLSAFALSSLTTPMRSGKADPLFSPNEVSRLSVDPPSLFSPLQTPQRPALQHSQFFSETPQHSFTHLFSPGPALFSSSASSFHSPAAFAGMTPATPERKPRNRLSAASPIQLLLPSPLSSPAAVQHSSEQQQQRQQTYDGGRQDGGAHKADDKPLSSLSITVNISSPSNAKSLGGGGEASRRTSFNSPSVSPTLSALTFPDTPTPLDKKKAAQDGQSFLLHANGQRRTADEAHNNSSHSNSADGSASRPTLDTSAASLLSSPTNSSSSSPSPSAASASLFSPSHSTLRFEPLHDLGDMASPSPYRSSPHSLLPMPLSLPMSLQSPFATPSAPARHRSSALLLSSPSSSLSAHHDSLQPPTNPSRAEPPVAQSTPSQLLPLLPATPATTRRESGGGGEAASMRGEWEELDKDAARKEQQRVEHSLPEPMMIA